jgi:hypothetical protein
MEAKRTNVSGGGYLIERDDCIEANGGLMHLVRYDKKSNKTYDREGYFGEGNLLMCFLHPYPHDMR